MGGSTAMMMFYPLDFLRTRMHTFHQGSCTSPLRSAKEIVRQEGLKGMYRGLGVSVVSHSLGWGMYLLSFRAAQRKIDDLLGGQQDGELSNANQGGRVFLSACCAATLTGFLITPIHVIKTRRQLHDGPKRERIGNMIKQDGWRAMFRGVGPQILLMGNTTIQVTLYEWFRRNAFSNREDPSSLEVGTASALSKTVACCLFNPLEVVRTRLQDKRNLGTKEYASMSSGLRTIYKNEGVCGLYRALPVNVMRVIPSTVVAFILYEKCLWLIRETHNGISGFRVDRKGIERQAHSQPLTH
ncbi:solute carrier family 25 (mitochondrial folate transporter), member 32 [Angomonas deanei]|nr:solute carrier family 25 (mitochondrial folate transporter), member 32 [Angomonas deanei]|eukprot:EPY28716.1 solute carrier family 25 (mitochondrial folate transporter), member 32 [Angomonas deanei]